MTRKQKILSAFDKNGMGLEIGPSFNPVAPKSEGYNVRILDHLSRENLIEKYRHQNSTIEKIEPVDYVWSGEDYAALIGTDKKFNWIIASHVIEHTPDLIAFLNNCGSVLDEAGVLSLAIPDKRYCFDHFRPPSSLAQVMDANTFLYKKPSHGMIADSKLNAVSRGGNFLWNPHLRGEMAFAYAPERAQCEIDQAFASDQYVDVHTWSFTPNSFRLLIQDLHFLGLTPFYETAFFPSSGNEFIIALKKGKCTEKTDRMTLARKAQEDLMPPMNHQLCSLLISLFYMPLRHIWHTVRHSHH